MHCWCMTGGDFLESCQHSLLHDPRWLGGATCQADMTSKPLDLLSCTEKAPELAEQHGCSALPHGLVQSLCLLLSLGESFMRVAGLSLLADNPDSELDASLQC